MAEQRAIKRKKIKLQQADRRFSKTLDEVEKDNLKYRLQFLEDMLGLGDDKDRTRPAPKKEKRI